jgi:hypothetical protein
LKPTIPLSDFEEASNSEEENLPTAKHKKIPNSPVMPVIKIRKLKEVEPVAASLPPKKQNFSLCWQCNHVLKYPFCTNATHVCSQPISDSTNKRKAGNNEKPDVKGDKRQRIDENSAPQLTLSPLSHPSSLKTMNGVTLNGVVMKRAHSIFCSFCRGLGKRRDCHNPRHRHGCPMDISSSTFPKEKTFEVIDSRMCPICQSLRKNCSDGRHVEGHFYRLPGNDNCQESVIPSEPEPSPTSATTNNEEKITRFNEEVLKQGEEKEKVRYYQAHHRPFSSSSSSSSLSVSADAMAAKLVPLIPLSKQHKKPIERLKESSMNSLGVFREIPKFEPLGKDAKPAKSSLKTASQNFTAKILSDDFDGYINGTVSRNKRKTKKILFSDETGEKPLHQLINYTTLSPGSDTPL